MAAGIKGVFLAIVFVSAFLPLDGAGRKTLKCFICGVANGRDVPSCDERNKVRTTTCETSCGRSEQEYGEVYRGCASEYKPDSCRGAVTIRNFVLPGCTCNTDLCNSAGYLHEARLFVFGLILFTIVSNLGGQHLN